MGVGVGGCAHMRINTFFIYLLSVSLCYDKTKIGVLLWHAMIIVSLETNV